MGLREETIAILNKYGLKANKSLGQNFMINQDVIDGIIGESKVCKDDLVIEIGPGIGSLTKALISNAKKVIAIELDENMVNILKTRFGLYDNFEIIHADILKTNLHELIEGYDSVKVVANLPYYITTPIIMKLLEEKIPIKSITVMVQKEVGERLCATHEDKEYGAISVSVRYYTEPRIALLVPRDNFLPAPEVDSCVVNLELLSKPRVKVNDEKVFFRLIKCAFSQRRKTISNSLASIGKPKEEVKEILNKIGIDEKLRAENLSIEQYASICNLF